MRIAKTMPDLAELFRDYDVKVDLTGNRIELTFPDREDDLPTSPHVPEPLVGDGRLDEPSGVNFARETRNVVRGLVNTPRFWRLTTVADQVHSFYLDGEKVGMVQILKKANQPLTIIFESEQRATEFYQRILNFMQRCPDCNSTNVTTTMQEDKFKYGEGEDAPELRATVPVRHCNACNCEYTDHVAEDIRTAAINAYLGTKQ
jgi:hypothetical protein